MVSGELEKSLRDEVDKYINSRLSELQDEVARIQGQLNEAFDHLRERARGETTDNMYVAASISEHMRAAHERGIEEAAAESSKTKSGSDMALIKAAVDDLDDQRSQSDILNTLVNRAAAFAPRIAFFVLRNEQAIGWRARGFEGTIGDEAIREIALPLSADTPLSEVARSRATWSGGPGHNAEDHLFLTKLGADPPQHIVAVPLLVRGRSVAVLYADSAALDSDSINLEALETLARVGSMAVELLAVGRPAPSARPARIEPQSSAPARQQPQEETTLAAEPVQPQAEAQQGQPQAEPHSSFEQPQASFEQPQSFFEQAQPAPEAEPERAQEAEQETTQETAQMPVAAEAEQRPEMFEAEPAAEHIEAHQVEPAFEEKGIAPFVAAPVEVDEEVTLLQEGVVATEPAPAPSSSGTAFAAETQSQVEAPSPSQYAAPLGGFRKYGSTDSELPVEVGDEERRLHNDARRFARLLVSEIKLYNEQKVREGRTEGDIYDRLRDDIDRSRQMYDKRVAPPVAARYDYFHQELVNTLAEGDPSKLGHSYPGSTVPA